jgi:hypothetical protein
VHPGKLHAHGKLVETHRVTYSIGKVGEYELHIGLRQQAMPLPGSPFRLRVSPGVASALTTSVPPNTSMPLVGTVGLHEVRVSLRARCPCAAAANATALERAHRACRARGLCVTVSHV